MRFNALVPSDLSVVNGNVICGGHTPLCGIAPKPGTECVLIEYVHQIFMTPIHISGINSLGAFGISAAQGDIASVLQKFGNVAVICHNLGYVSSCFFRNRKSEIIPNKPPQSVKHPTENLIFLRNQFIRKERIIHSALWNRLCCENNHSPCKSVRFVI